MRTSGLVAGRHLVCGHRNDRHFTAYYAVAPSLFHGMIVRWRRCRPVGASLTPILSRSGRGHGAGNAAGLGVPFSRRSWGGAAPRPGAHRPQEPGVVARRGTRASPPCGCTAAMRRSFPSRPVRAWPFSSTRSAPRCCAGLLRAWSRNLAERAGQLDILYVNNEQERVLEREPGFARLFLGQVRRSQADAVADRTILTRAARRRVRGDGLGGLFDLSLGGKRQE